MTKLLMSPGKEDSKKLAESESAFFKCKENILDYKNAPAWIDRGVDELE